MNELIAALVRRIACPSGRRTAGARHVLAAAVLACLGLTFAVPGMARADSPLTSTPFHQAYLDVPAVRAAAQSGLTPEVMESLRDRQVGMDVRAAIVNALGWDVDGQDHAARFLEHIATERRTTVERLTLRQLSPEELFALGYMRAMEDYMFLRPIGRRAPVARLAPVALIDEAQRRAPQERAIAVIRGLVASQASMGSPSGWCDVWTTFDEVADTGAMRPAAAATIWEYMSLYVEDCSNVETEC